MPKKVTKKAGTATKSAKPKEEKKKPVEILPVRPVEEKELEDDEEPKKTDDEVSPDALEAALGEDDDSYEADMDEEGGNHRWE